MPRNSSGTYSLPQAAFVSGTVIASAAMNSNLSDIATALSGSVASNGVTPMTGPLQAFAGTVSSPGLTFVGNTSAGIYSVSTNVIGISNNNTLTVTFNADNTTSFAASVSVTGSLTLSQNLAVTGTGSVTGAFSTGDKTTNAVLGSDPATPAASKLVIYAKNDSVGKPKYFTKDPDGLVSPLFGYFGQCRLTVSGGNLLLIPYNGNIITINDRNYQIPDAGVTLLRAGIADSTFYYVYLYDNSGTLTLELSATAYVAQNGSQIQIKSGDATRTLVGAVYSSTTSFKDTDGNLLTLSWFNRRVKTSNTGFTNGRSISGTSGGVAVEVNSEIRCNFINWADDRVKLKTTCAHASAGTSLNLVYIVPAVDTASLTFSGVASNINICQTFSPVSTQILSSSVEYASPVGTYTENAVHYATLLVNNTSATAMNLNAFSSSNSLCKLSVVIVEING